MKLSISIALLLKTITPNKMTSEYFCDLRFKYIKRRIYITYSYTYIQVRGISHIYAIPQKD